MKGNKIFSKKKLRKITILILIVATILFIPAVSKLVIRKQEWITLRAISTTERYNTDGQPSVYHWQVDTLKPGDEERSASGKVIAKLKNIETYQDGSRKIAVIDVSVLSTYNPVTKRFRYKNQDLLISTNFEFNLGDNRLSAQLIEINPTVDKKRRIKIEGIVSWLKRWHADAIKVGDVYTDQSNQSTPVRVIDKKLSPSEEKLLTSNWEALNKSLFWDVKVTLSLEVSERLGNYYFAYLQPIKVGNTIFVPMDKYNLYSLVVTSIDDSE